MQLKPKQMFRENNVKPTCSVILVTIPFFKLPKIFGLKYVSNSCHRRNTWPVVFGSCPRTCLHGFVMTKDIGGRGAVFLLGMTVLSTVLPEFGQEFKILYILFSSPTEVNGTFLVSKMKRIWPPKFLTL